MSRTNAKRRGVALAAVVVMLLVAGAVSAVSFRSHPSSALLPNASASAEMAVEHNPPRLVLPDEAVRLDFNVICPSADGNACSPVGSLNLRSLAGTVLPSVPLVFDKANELLTATLPARLVGSGLRYSLSVVDPLSLRKLRYPADGSFDELFVLRAPHIVDLGEFQFGSTVAPTEHVVVADWGNQDEQLGLDTGPEQATIGPAAFALDGDALAILDQVNRRVVVDGVEGTTYLAIDGAKVDDLVFDSAGNLVLLDHDAPKGAIVRTMRIDGSPVGTTAIQGDTFEMLRRTTAGVFVHGQPGARWVPIGASRTTSGLPMDGGRSLLVRGSSSDLRFGVAVGSSLLASWRIVGSPSFGDLQLVEVDEDSLTVVVRRYNDSIAEFQLIHADSSGHVESRSFAPNDWAETNALGRFELQDGQLFQLGSSPDGASVVRYDVREVLS